LELVRIDEFSSENEAFTSSDPKILNLKYAIHIPLNKRCYYRDNMCGIMEKM